MEYQRRTAISSAPAKTQTLSAFTCFVLGSCFALLDAASTWYALRFTDLPEANPVLRWAFEQVGVGAALAIRVFAGCAALAILAWGVSARLPNYERLFNLGCRVLLVAALVLWGTVAVSNVTQIVFVHVRGG